MKKLSEKEIQNDLEKLSGWELIDGKLHKEYKFKDFNQAFKFMNELAITATKIDHHPDWSNSYNIVNINLMDHSTGGITALDFKLAEAAEKIAAHLST